MQHCKTPIVAMILIMPLLPAFSQSSASPVHSGQNAVRISNATPQWHPGDVVGLDRQYNQIRIYGGHKLKIGFWIRSDNQSTCTVDSATVASFSNTGFIKDTDLFKKRQFGPEWELNEFDYDAPAEATRINLAFKPVIEEHSAFLIDDVSVKDMASNLELLSNGGFEDWQATSTTPKGWRFFASPGTSASLERATPTAAMDADYSAQ